MYNFWKRPFTLYIWGFLSIYHWTLSLWKVNGKRRQRAVCFIELLSSILFFLKIWYSIDNYFCIAIIPLLLKFSRKSILFVHTDSYIRSIVAAWWAYVLCRSDFVHLYNFILQVFLVVPYGLALMQTVLLCCRDRDSLAGGPASRVSVEKLGTMMSYCHSALRLPHIKFFSNKSA